MERLMISLLLVTCSISSNAQQGSRTPRDTRPMSERIWFGGGLGLSFGSATSIQVDPLIGYKVDPPGKFSVGLGGSYWYYRDNRYVPPVEFSGFGYRVFSRYRVFEQLYLHAEFLHMNIEAYDLTRDDLTRIWVPHILLGAGYSQPIGGHSAFYFQVLFEVLQDPHSVYLNQGPIMSAGVGIGF